MEPYAKIPSRGAGEVVVVLPADDLLLVCRNLKKPSANLPFLETSLSPTARAWPTVRVSPFGVVVVAEPQRNVGRREGNKPHQHQYHVVGSHMARQEICMAVVTN
jgi:hypothetical protein